MTVIKILMNNYLKTTVALLVMMKVSFTEVVKSVTLKVHL